jgi:hypothetical protein
MMTRYYTHFNNAIALHCTIFAYIFDPHVLATI